MRVVSKRAVLLAFVLLGLGAFVADHAPGPAGRSVEYASRTAARARSHVSPMDARVGIPLPVASRRGVATHSERDSRLVAAVIVAAILTGAANHLRKGGVGGSARRGRSAATFVISRAPPARLLVSH